MIMIDETFTAKFLDEYMLLAVRACSPNASTDVLRNFVHHDCEYRLVAGDKLLGGPLFRRLKENVGASRQIPLHPHTSSNVAAHHAWTRTVQDASESLKVAILKARLATDFSTRRRGHNPDKGQLSRMAAPTSPGG